MGTNLMSTQVKMTFVKWPESSFRGVMKFRTCHPSLNTSLQEDSKLTVCTPLLLHNTKKKKKTAKVGGFHWHVLWHVLCSSSTSSFQMPGICLLADGGKCSSLLNKTFFLFHSQLPQFLRDWLHLHPNCNAHKLPLSNTGLKHYKTFTLSWHYKERTADIPLSAALFYNWLITDKLQMYSGVRDLRLVSINAETQNFLIWCIHYTVCLLLNWRWLII